MFENKRLSELLELRRMLDLEIEKRDQISQIFSARTANILRRNGVFTIQKLKELIEKRAILRLEGMGVVSSREIYSYLEE